MDDLRLQIRGQLSRYLAGQVDLRTLYDWLVPATWEIEKWAPEETVSLARNVQLFLEELSHGDWTEDELKSHLRGIVGFGAELQELEVQADSASTTVTAELPVSFGRPVPTVEWRPAGKRFETAFA